MASVTITIPNSGWDLFSNTHVRWNVGTSPLPGIPIGNTLSSDGTTDLYLETLIFPRTTSIDVFLRFADAPTDYGEAGQDLNDQMEASGTITFTASDSSTLTITGIGDATEPYQWMPSNIADVNTFASNLAGLSDRALTVTFDDNPTPDASAPTVTVTSANNVDSEGMLSVSAAVSGGEYDTIAYAWDDGSEGGSFSAQAASTVYTAPDVSSDTDVTLTCTVTVEGDGTNATDGTTDTTTGLRDITVNAIDLMPVAPSVDDQAGFVDTAISTLTLPIGTGGDGALTYALSGLPAGLSFDVADREITGTPTTAGEYTVTYTVTDSDSVNPDSDSSQFTYRIAGFDDSGLDVSVFVQVVIESTSADYYETGGTNGGETVGTVDLAVDDVDITIDRVRNRNSGQQVLLRRTGAGSWMTEFENTGGAYNTGGWQFTFALATGNIVMDVPGNVNSGTNAINLRLDIPSGEQSNFNDLTEGHPFILVLSRTTPTTVAHAIDGGDINWLFELFEPDVTHRLAPVAHAIDGGDINWAFALRRPRVTHRQLNAPVAEIAPRINDQPFRDALISQWRAGSTAPQLIDIMLVATDRLFIANVNLLLKGLDIDALKGVLLDFAGYRFGLRRPLVDLGRSYFGFDGTGNTPLTGSFDEAPFFSQNAFSDTKAPLPDRFFRPLVKLAAFNKIGVKTNEKCLGALQTVYPDGYIQDNEDLSITYFVDDSILMLSVLIGEMNLWPKPAGIAYDVMAIP